MEHVLTRRSLAAAIPLAALAAAPAAAASLPSSQHPDGGLLKLVEALHAGEAHREECDQAADRAFERIDFPDIPEALIWRKSDFLGICTDRDRCAQYLIGGKLQHVYESADDIASWWTDPRPCPNPYAFSEQDRPRANEILSALAEWEGGKRRAEDEAGYTEAQQVADRAAEHCRDLRRRIIFARARTPDGMMAKVRAMTTLFPEDPAWVEQRLKAAVAQGEGADISRWFGMSLALDAMSLRDDASQTTALQKGAAA